MNQSARALYGLGNPNSDVGAGGSHSCPRTATQQTKRVMTGRFCTNPKKMNHDMDDSGFDDGGRT